MLGRQPKRTLISWRGELGQLFFIEVDAVTREQPTMSSQITDHPVETGANISDHVRAEPLKLEIEGVITNTPHYLPKDHVGVDNDIILDRAVANIQGFDNRSKVSGVRPTLGNIIRGPLGVGTLIPIGAAQEAQIGRQVPNTQVAALTARFLSEFDRVRAVYDEVQNLWQAGTLVDVETALSRYEQMAIESFSPNREAGYGDTLRFTMAFKQVRVVSSKLVAIPRFATKKVAKGTITPEEDEDPEAVGAYVLGLFK